MKQSILSIVSLVMVGYSLYGQNHTLIEGPIGQVQGQSALRVLSSRDTVFFDQDAGSDGSYFNDISANLIGIRGISDHPRWTILDFGGGDIIRFPTDNGGIGGSFYGSSAGVVAKSQGDAIFCSGNRGIYAKGFQTGITAVSEGNSNSIALDVRGSSSGGLAARFIEDVYMLNNIIVSDTSFLNDVQLQNSLALGMNSIASNSNTFSSGRAALALGPQCTAIGDNVKSTGSATIAMGFGSMASGINSISLGTFANASGNYAMAFGKNISTNGKTGALIIGDSNPRTEGVANVGANDQFVARFDGGYFFRTGAGSAGIVAGPNANAWSAICDKRKKENFRILDDKMTLAKLTALDYTTWNYIGQDPVSNRHYGIMAQDFYNLFGQDDVGKIGNDTLVNPIDLIGVAMSALKGAKLEIEELKTSMEVQLKIVKSLVDQNIASTEKYEILLKKVGEIESKSAMIKTELRDQDNKSHSNLVKK